MNVTRGEREEVNILGRGAEERKIPGRDDVPFAQAHAPSLADNNNVLTEHEPLGGLRTDVGRVQCECLHDRFRIGTGISGAPAAIRPTARVGPRRSPP